MGVALNWLVQGVLVAAAAAVGLMAAGRTRPAVRHRTHAWALGLIVALPLVALAREWAQPASGLGIAPLPVVAVPEQVWNRTTLAVAAWSVWMAMCATRLAWDVSSLARVRQRCRRLPDGVLERLSLAMRARVRQAGAQLAVSEDVRAAAVLGWGQPIVALHPGVVAQLNDQELEQVVAHEWAHVVRRDFRATLVQQLVRVVAGWHPAVVWTLRRLKAEREMACDDMAIAATGGLPVAYSKCLTRLASIAPARAGAELSVGALTTSTLRQRVESALDAGPRSRATTRLHVLALPALLVLVTGSVGSVGIFGLEAKTAHAFESLSAGAGRLSDEVAALAGAVTPRAASTRAASPRAPQAERAPAVFRRATAPASPAESHSTTGEPAEALAQAAEAVVVGLLPTSVPLANDTPDQQVATDPAAQGSSTPAVPRTAPWPVADAATPAQLASSPVRTAAESAGVAWAATSDAAIVVARQSKTSAVAAAGFFSRVSKRVASSVSSF